jgi:hypothetical protein
MLAVITIEAVAAELGIEPKNPGFKDRSRSANAVSPQSFLRWLAESCVLEHDQDENPERKFAEHVGAVVVQPIVHVLGSPESRTHLLSMILGLITEVPILCPGERDPVSEREDSHHEC